MNINININELKQAGITQLLQRLISMQNESRKPFYTSIQVLRQALNVTYKKYNKGSNFQQCFMEEISSYPIICLFHIRFRYLKMSNKSLKKRLQYLIEKSKKIITIRYFLRNNNNNDFVTHWVTSNCHELFFFH